MPLTDAKIRTTKPSLKPQKLSDGAGLHLEVRPSGAKLWRYRYRIDGRENLYALGEYPEISLQEARAERERARALVKQGVHPSHERSRSRASSIAANKDTFKALAEEWISEGRPRWTAYYASQIESYFARDVYPKIGRRPMRSLTSVDVMDVIKAISGRGAKAAAINVRQWISAVFCYAVANLRADSDPAAALRRTIIRDPVEHARSLSDQELRLFFSRLSDFKGNRTTAIALRLLMLMWTRTAELRKAEWVEFNIAERLWTIPPGRMKRRRKHLVPLSDQAIELLLELREITGAGRYLFPNNRRPKEVMSATTINRALEHMGFASGEVTGHDFRATGSTHMLELGYRKEHIDVQLAHAKKSRTDAAYDHAIYLPQRTEMLQAWAAKLEVMEQDSESMV
ncbi:integrase arm-type DNA-binding domain-containing protein [Stenotrophomonas sp. PS02297]|uniref:tyrosine-type recombinase/integrase n=1 Tax=unclassified Stenotrophomonas TaxID=196198 RepID=UPI00249CC650|nr:integrase arm-type DNA-binding domain-containing protein [Stenotrophomonas sp. PS02297]